MVATYHYDIKQVKSTELASSNASKSVGSGLYIEDATSADWKLFLVQVEIRVVEELLIDPVYHQVISREL